MVAIDVVNSMGPEQVTENNTIFVEIVMEGLQTNLTIVLLR